MEETEPLDVAGDRDLLAFVAANWADETQDQDDTHKPPNTHDKSLDVDNEAPHPATKATHRLTSAKQKLLDEHERLLSLQPGLDTPTPDHAFSAHWWAARCVIAHSRCLQGPSPTLDALAARCFAAAAAAIDMEGAAVAGRAVMVTGLVGKPELNGQRGTVRSLDGETGRIAVRLDTGGQPLLLKRENLLLLDDGDTTTGDADDCGDGSSHRTAWRAQFELERAQWHMQHRRLAQASASLEAAKRLLGLTFSTTGRLGRRTRYQETSIAQLHQTVCVRHRPPPVTAEELSAAACGFPPRRVDGNDATLLEEIDFDELGASDAAEVGAPREVAPSMLWPVEQLALLSEASLLRASQPHDGVSLEQLEPYVTSALAAPRNWVAQSMALHLKARLDGSKSRLRHQSLMQLEALVEGTTPGALRDRAEECGVSHAELAMARVRGFWAGSLEPLWRVKAELARSYAALGMFTEASRLFGENGLWEEYVEALILIGDRMRAEQVVRERLEAEERAPAMLCLLGDLTEEEAHYVEAWEASKGACARAKLALGARRMKRGDWAGARNDLAAALGVKAHLAEAWFCSGVCALKQGEGEGALADFRRVVSCDPEHYQAWASLGSLLAQAGQKREALCALREACRLRPKTTSLWRNAAALAVDLKLFSEATFRLSHALRMGAPPDAPLSARLAQAVTQRERSTDGTSATRILPQLRELFRAGTAADPRDSSLWAAWVYLEAECGSLLERDEPLVGHLDALREATTWKSDATALKHVAEAAAQLVEARTDAGADEPRLRATLALVRTLLRDVKDDMRPTPGYEELRMSETRLARHLDDA